VIPLVPREAGRSACFQLAFSKQAISDRVVVIMTLARRAHNTYLIKSSVIKHITFSGNTIVFPRRRLRRVFAQFTRPLRGAKRICAFAPADRKG